MKLVAKRRRVVGLTVREVEPGYRDPTVSYFNVLREETRVLGVLVRVKELDRESVSVHDKIEAGCFGSTGFVSKFAHDHEAWVK